MTVHRLAQLYEQKYPGHFLDAEQFASTASKEDARARKKLYRQLCWAAA